jgi:hypothetical protein
VDAVAVSGSTAYIGGSFDYVGAVTGRFAAVDASTGRRDSAFPATPGGLGAFTPDDSRGAYAAGDLTIAGAQRHGLFHLLADATVDPHFMPLIGGGDVTVLKFSGSTVYAGGSFSTVDGQTGHRYLAAFDSATGAVRPWHPDPDAAVSAIALRTSVQGFLTIYVGGSFNTVNGSLTRHHLAAFDDSLGNATAFDPDVNGAVEALGLSGPSNVYAGGSVTKVNVNNATNGNLTRNNLAAVSGTSRAATAWTPDVDNGVSTLAVSGSTIFAAGLFSHVAGGTTPRSGLAAFDLTNGTPTAFDPHVCRMPVGRV